MQPSCSSDLLHIFYCWFVSDLRGRKSVDTIRKRIYFAVTQSVSTLCCIFICDTIYAIYVCPFVRLNVCVHYAVSTFVILSMLHMWPFVHLYACVHYTVSSSVIHYATYVSLCSFVCVCTQWCTFIHDTLYVIYVSTCVCFSVHAMLCHLVPSTS